MTSNALYTWLIKYTLPVAVFLLIGISVQTGSAEHDPKYVSLILLGISSNVLLFWMTYNDRVVRVKIGSQTITIIHKGEEESVPWSEIDTIQQLFFIDLPIYELSVKDRIGCYVFTTQLYFAYFGFGTRDLSDMGTLIRKKKKEYGI